MKQYSTFYYCTLVGYCLLAISWNISTSLSTISSVTTTNLKQPGYEFAPLQPLLKNEKMAGFLTDKALDPEDLQTGFFLSAQYQLAPIILDLGNEDHNYVIVYADSTRKLRSTAAKISGDVIFHNNKNIALIKRP